MGGSTASWSILPATMHTNPAPTFACALFRYVTFFPFVMQFTKKKILIEETSLTFLFNFIVI